ncbi:unnamed protein product [Spirodela intermedia]|uniref:Uncharacterized protein n=1 Tax=Spirodela intermedia TaxID=51605 RepID=A0A7I8L900_SPIIN|nr:unnamed protein product [Spirodela intermedia]
MMRGSCRPEEGVKRGAWTSQEDKLLSEYIAAHGLGRWRSLPKNAGLNRCPKSCRLRWLNYLRPGIKRGNITEEEEELIIRLHNLLGNRWSLIAGRLPGRTDNEIKNYWNTCLRKKATGEFPKKHHPRCSAGDEEPGGGRATASLVIRTKAHRCTRFVVKNQVADVASDLPEPPIPVASDDSGFRQNLYLQMVSPPPLEFDVDGFFTHHGVQNSSSSTRGDYYFFGCGSRATAGAGEGEDAIADLPDEDGFLIDGDSEREDLLQFLAAESVGH